MARNSHILFKTDLPKSEKGELLKEGREAERELAPQAMPRVF